jgi:hypothetical protein
MKVKIGDKILFEHGGSVSEGKVIGVRPGWSGTALAVQLLKGQDWTCVTRLSSVFHVIK